MIEIEEKERIIEEVMDGFDFGKVEKAMESLNWCWDVDGKMEVPSRSVIEWRAEDLLDSVMKFYGDNSRVTTSCGGLKATLLANGKLMLEFVLDESEAE